MKNQKKPEKNLKRKWEVLDFKMAQEDRVEKTGEQKGLFGENHDLVEFKNIKEKRELKEKVKAMFKGEMIRSIITAVDGNKRLNKLERLDRSSQGSDIESTMTRADAFGKKTMTTLSTFPSNITQSYMALLSQEGDKVLDLFAGHNSRCEDVLSANRKYYGWDVHTFPLDFIRKACTRFKEGGDYFLHQTSSEKLDYEDNLFDFAITCPPYADVEQYNKIYSEERTDDLSSKKYTDFLWLYNKCIKESFRTLKPGAFSVIVVGDTHRNGKLQSLMIDTIKICKLAGFDLHDINIYNRKSNIGGDLNYKTFILTCKRFPGIHEYILIFKKPGILNNNKEVQKNECNL